MIVSYLQSGLVDDEESIDEVRYPSLGSLIDFRLIYSSYSKSPAFIFSFWRVRTLTRFQTIEFRMLPVKRQFGQKEVDIIS